MPRVLIRFPVRKRRNDIYPVVALCFPITYVILETGMGSYWTRLVIVVPFEPI